MGVNAAAIDRAYAAACGGRDSEPPILAARRKQLQRVTWSDTERVGQPVADDERTSVVSEII